MNRAGAIEVLLPALQPPEIWQQSGRYETASAVLFKAKDNANREWVLSATAEEVITTIAAGEINSYRQLPKNFYQISVKVPRRNPSALRADARARIYHEGRL